MIKGFGASAILAVLAVSPSAANDFALILASQPNDLKAIEYSQSLVARGTFRGLDDFSFLRSSNGWLAVSLGVFDKAQCENRLADAKTRPGVPRDAYCSPTQRFTEKLDFVAGRLQASSSNNSPATSNAAPPTAMAPPPAAERRSWRTLSREFTRCADITLRRSNSSVASLMQQRIEPDDPRLNSIMKFCEGVTSMVARKDFECDLRTTSSATIRTRCFEEFVYVAPNGAKIPLTFDDVVNRRLANQTVSLLQTERSDAVESRRVLEQQKKEEERLAAEKQRELAQAERAEKERAQRLRDEQAAAEKAAIEATRPKNKFVFLDISDDRYIYWRKANCENVINAASWTANGRTFTYSYFDADKKSGMSSMRASEKCFREMRESPSLRGQATKICGSLDRDMPYENVKFDDEGRPVEFIQSGLSKDQQRVLYQKTLSYVEDDIANLTLRQIAGPVEYTPTEADKKPTRFWFCRFR
jgi:flagellar biosynthesis GTPase FlhF